jgi:hypothetical protein
MVNGTYLEAARAALARAAWTRGAAPAYDEEAVVDLLTDLRHWCSAAGIDFPRCDHLAWAHHQDEIGGAS